MSSRGSSAGSRNAMLGSSRSDSLNSSMTVVSLKRRASHIQARINSAKRKNQTELVNSIAALKIEIQVMRVTAVLQENYRAVGKVLN